MAKKKGQKSQRSKRKAAINQAVKKGIAVPSSHKKSVVEKGISLEEVILLQAQEKAAEIIREAEARAREAEARAREAEARAREAEARAEAAEQSLKEVSEVKPKSNKALERYIEKEKKAKEEYKKFRDIVTSQQEKTKKNFEGLTDEEKFEAFEQLLVEIIEDFTRSGSTLQIALSDGLQRFRELRAEAKGNRQKTNELVTEVEKNYALLQAGVIDSDRIDSVVNNITLFNFSGIELYIEQEDYEPEDFDTSSIDEVFEDFVNNRGYR